MNGFKTRIGVAASTAAIILSSFVGPAVAGVDIQVTGNGSDSNNTVNYNQTSDTNVTQNNTANITNNVSANANTGKNDANDNTGGDVTVDTGDATTNVSISNAANQNSADVDGCCPGDVDVKVSGNGSDSDNDVTVDIDNDVDVDQDNDAYFDNYVYAKSNTGKNDANDNTGGDVTIDTGDADSSVTIGNWANANAAQIGGGEGGAFSVEISGNGSYSDNNVDLDFGSNLVDIDQNNYADFYNDVYAKSNTGKNDANDNTGGDVSIDTGDADSNVNVENAANVNWADIDACGCVLDGSVKVSGNGSDSDNDVTLDLDSDVDVDQDNDADFDNDLDAKSNTGKNDANDNTSFDGDPSIDTGNSSDNVDVENKANKNVVGNVEIDEGSNVDISINLEGLLALLLSLID